MEILTKDYVFYVTGGEYESNGFSIDYNLDIDEVNPKTFVGYGDFSYYNYDNEIKTIDDLLKLINENWEKIDEIETPLSDFEFLKKILLEQKERKEKECTI